jgi:ATP:ADP antiporter, AAA family
MIHAKHGNERSWRAPAYTRRRVRSVAGKRIDVQRHEWTAVGLSFLYFFALLSSYYILRPIRDEFGVSAGVDKLPWLFTGTFLVMLVVSPIYTALVAVVPRRRIVPIAYHAFALMLGGFFLLLRAGVDRDAVGKVFFVWTSVYILFVVSVFWSLMADLFTAEQGERLFGLVAAGGSAGALAGPLLTTLLVGRIGAAWLLLLSAVLVEACVVCVLLLVAWARRHGKSELAARADERMGGSVLAGAELAVRSPMLRGICLQTLLYTAMATLVYFQQAAVLKQAIPDRDHRTEVLALMDLAVNGISLIVQGVLFARLLRWFGTSTALAAAPALSVVGFVALAMTPLLWVFVAVQVARRAAHYALEGPASELLFTAVGREERYKSKAFIDTVVYRGGDFTAAWAREGAVRLGAGLVAISAAGVPLAAAGVAVAIWLGRRYEKERP